MFRSELLEICKFVWPSCIFSLFSRMWISFGGVKSQNEFAASEIDKAKLCVVVAGNFEKFEISWKVDAPGRFLALKSLRGFRLREFHCLRRRGPVGAGATAAPELNSGSDFILSFFHEGFFAKTFLETQCASSFWCCMK